MKRFVTLFIFILLIIVFTTLNGQVIWMKDSLNPILYGGEEGSWNRYIFQPCVLYNEDSARFEMWFGACKEPSQNNWRPYQIGYAVSEDCINWNMHESPVLSPTPGKWDEATVEGHAVIRADGTYKMWYTGWNLAEDSIGIGYATSPDGITWTKHPSIILGAGINEWEEYYPYSCSVMLVSEEYKMWYAATNMDESEFNIGYATSVDGINWQKDSANNPVLKVGDEGSWDDYGVSLPYVHLIKSTFYMWYTGGNKSTQKKMIGSAWSKDGISWTKYNDSTTTSGIYAGSDPVLRPDSGAWDGSQVELGSVLVNDDTLHMWYNAWQSPSPPNLIYIGHATLSLDTLFKYIPTGIEKYDNSFIPKGYSVTQNYPNPFNPSTTIEFTLPKSEYVELKVYNILGKEISTLVSTKLNQGNHTYTFDGSKLASGIYYYQLMAGDYREVKKMILLK